jgi:putative endonuclease
MLFNQSRNESSVIGRQAEEAVRFLLARSGFREVTRNFSAYQFGEIDLIFFKSDTLYVLEVRLRKEGGRFGGPAESIRPLKRKRILNSANYLISSYGLSSYDVSFWAACVLYSPGINNFHVKFIPF